MHLLGISQQSPILVLVNYRIRASTSLITLLKLRKVIRGAVAGTATRVNQHHAFI
jgi:hypothetical protein